MNTRMARTVRFDHWRYFWTRGQMREPRIPAVGVSTPIRMSEEAGICRDVFAKRMDVDVIVVKPRTHQIKIKLQFL